MTQIEIQQQFNELKKLLKDNFINSKEVLTSNEILSYLNISYSLLSKLTSAGLIPHYKPTNGHLFFIKSEIHAWIKENKIFTEKDAEILLKNHNYNKKA
jgi:excisionase family DNA binding protein